MPARARSPWRCASRGFWVQPLRIFPNSFLALSCRGDERQDEDFMRPPPWRQGQPAGSSGRSPPIGRGAWFRLRARSLLGWNRSWRRTIPLPMPGCFVLLGGAAATRPMNASPGPPCIWSFGTLRHFWRRRHDFCAVVAADGFYAAGGPQGRRHPSTDPAFFFTQAHLPSSALSVNAPRFRSSMRLLKISFPSPGLINQLSSRKPRYRLSGNPTYSGLGFPRLLAWQGPG